jgi:phage tail sheath protein FI
MPAQLTYPGVYIEEVPSGVHTIVGVATSITAFLGRTRWGPENEATTVFGFTEFAKRFGGLWADSSLPYAVRDFYLNGGRQAVIVRLTNGATTQPLPIGDLPLEAASPGTWGVELRAELDQLDITDDVAQQLGVDKSELFNLTVRHVIPGGATETFLHLSVGDNASNVTKVLERDSKLVRVQKDWEAADGWTPATPTAPETVVRDELGKLEYKVEQARTAFQTGSGTKDDLDKATDALRQAVDAARAALSDGTPLTAAQFIGDNLAPGTGLKALDAVDLFNLLCIPPHSYDPGTDLEDGLVSAAMDYCHKRRALLIADPLTVWKDPQKGSDWLARFDGPRENAALYFPRFLQPDPEQSGRVREFVPCGAVAGVMARTDTDRGVWKAPAGLQATLSGVPDLTVRLNDDQSGELNPLGINCLRAFPIVGRVIWGARTLAGADMLASEWKYVPVRRLALYLEESLYRGTQWVVFEPNDEPLWAQIRLSVGSFMHEQFRQGAFQGATPREAYFVKCDGETTTQADRDRGIVNILVGFAPLKPAEFVVIRIQQIAPQLEV